MTIEQPTTLSELLCQTSEARGFTWWDFTKLISPLIFFLVILGAEFTFLDGRSFGDYALRMLIIIAVLFVPLVMLLGRLGSRLTKRSLTITDKGAYTAPAYNEIPWKKLGACQFEPVGPEGSLVQFNLKWTIFGTRKRWSILLADKTQEEQLLAELEKRKNLGIGSFSIEKFSVPIQLPKFKVQTATLWLGCIGLFLALQALPFLVGGLSPEETPAKPCGRQQMNPRVRSYLAEHLYKKSLPERRQSFIKFGAAFAIPAGLFIAAGSILNSRRTKRRFEEIERAEAKAREGSL